MYIMSLDHIHPLLFLDFSPMISSVVCLFVLNLDFTYKGNWYLPFRILESYTCYTSFLIHAIFYPFIFMACKDHSFKSFILCLIVCTVSIQVSEDAQGGQRH